MIRRLHAMASTRRFARVALLLVMLAAFGAQQWAVQSHWHADARLQAAGALSGGVPDGAPADQDCLWCHVASHASSTAPPSAAQWLLAADSVFEGRLPAGFQHDFPSPAAHAWRSRGPPQA